FYFIECCVGCSSALEIHRYSRTQCPWFAGITPLILEFFKSLGWGSIPAVSLTSSVHGACFPAGIAGVVLMLRGRVPSPRIWVPQKRLLPFYCPTCVNATKTVNGAVWVCGYWPQAF
ncbi:hypothetical protein H1C71_032040, partial [Ictidomys tridecemlineatus]